MIYIYIYACVCPFRLNMTYLFISADPGLRQGRGGAWDHRRCGTCFVTAMAFTLSKASTKPCGCKLLLFQRCNLPFGAHSLCC